MSKLVRVTFNRLSGEVVEIFTMYELTSLSKSLRADIVSMQLSLGLKDKDGVELFEGDTVVCWTCTIKQKDGTFVPDKQKPWTINKVSDLYGSPFHGGKCCEIYLK